MQPTSRRGLEIVGRLCVRNQLNGVIAHGAYREACVTRALHGTTPTNNFIQRTREKTQEQAEQKVFDAQMKIFLDRRNETFNGDVYLRFLETLKSAGGLTGVKGAFNQNNPAMHEMNEKMTIINSMTPAERLNPELVHKGQAAKRRMSNTSGFEVEKVEETLDGMAMYSAIQDWVRKREDAGLCLPKSSAELQGMIRVRGSGLKQKPPRRRTITQSPGLGHTIRRKYL